MKKIVGVAFVLLVLVGVYLGEDKEDAFRMVLPGVTKDYIKARLGEPYEKLSFPKTKDAVWGPEEEFWDKIPNNSVLDLWRYQDDTGHLNLYFKEGDERLAYKAFAPKGVVYESGN